MALSDADYAAWLDSEDAGKDPVVLCEADVFLSATVAPGGIAGEYTVYFSDKGYIDKFDLDAPNYEPLIIGDVTVDDNFSGVTIEEIQVFKDDNDWDVTSALFNGREFRIYLGDRSWPRSDFRLQMTGITYAVLRPHPALYSFTFQELGAEYLDQIITFPGFPFAYGECTNLRLLKQSSTEFVFYSDSDPSVSWVAIDGLIKDFVTDYTLSWDSGAKKKTITFTSAVDGVVTVRGGVSGAISEILPIISSQVDVAIPLSSQLTDFDSLNLNYCVYSDGETARGIIEYLVSGIGGNLRVNSAGELEVFQIAEPGTPTRTTIDADVPWQEVGFYQIGQDTPIEKFSLGFQRNWNVMQSVDIDPATDIGFTFLTQEYRYSSASASASEVRGSERVVTSLEGSAEGNAENSRRFALKSTARVRYLRGGFYRAFADAIGDTITVESRHYGFSAGADFVVIGNRKILTKGICEQTLWK